LAKRNALNYPNGALSVQMELLQRIAKAEACFNFAAAKATVDSINDPITRELGYIEIIKTEPQTDMTARIILAEAIPVPSQRPQSKSIQILSNRTKKRG
jgi:hypothetical protein